VRWLFNRAERGRQGRGKRGEERFTTDLLTSTLGDVIDLSGSGLRIRRAGGAAVTVGQVLKVTLKSDQCQVTLKCRVVRVQKLGLRRCDIGLAFVEIKPGLKNALHSLARFGFIPNLGRGAEQSPAPPKAHRSAIPDYYGLLNIPPTATEERIRTAYHEAARKYHPDADRSASRVFMFEAVTEAYKILRDPVQRRDYDARRAKSLCAA
jgi:DnaJ-like protein/PilZ domain-containing protein